jgi:hypothetical protein
MQGSDIYMCLYVCMCVCVFDFVPTIRCKAQVCMCVCIDAYVCMIFVVHGADMYVYMY